MDPNPQQTGNGLLIRHGEVATTSGSTTLPGANYVPSIRKESGCAEE